MKKLFGSLLLFILSTSCVCAQGINYQKSLDDALALATKNNKPVFIYIHLPMPSAPPPNLPANIHVNYTSGLEAKEVADFYNKKFICYQVNPMDSAGIKLRDKYQLNVYPTYIFLDPKGEIFYKDNQFSPVPEKFMSMAGEALGRLASGKTISHYDELDKRSTITGEELKEYITLREDLGLFDNSVLIDKYVNFITINSLNDYNTVLFILKAGPYAFGKAYTLCFTNKKITDSVYKHEPAAVRSAINNHIIVNTRNEAIKTKNALMAQQVANYVRSTWGKNYTEANKASTNQLLVYYWAIKDTARYYQQASFYYDTYYLNISADSARKLQQKTLDNFKKSHNIEDSVITHNKDNTTTQISKTTIVQSGPKNNSVVASALNTAAWDFYILGTHNTNYLIKALVWCRRAIELQPASAYYDTMAHVMYRLDFYDEAVLNQNKAVEMAANESQPKIEQDKLKKELEKIRAHQL